MDLMPSWLIHIFSVVMGLIVGSFVNVLVVRLPHHQSVALPRSHCPACKATIRWYDNIPVFSYLLLRGKCRHCMASISIRYPVIELLTAVLFLAVELRFGWSIMLLIRDWPFVASLVAITFIDLEHRIIPDRLSLGGMVWGLLTSLLGLTGILQLYPGIEWTQSFLGAGLGFGVFYLLAWVYQAWSGRSGLGGGDIKLLGMLGAFLGPYGVFVTILLSSVFGSLVGIGWALVTRQKNLLSVAIPYGPFLVVGGLYYYLMELG